MTSLKRIIVSTIVGVFISLIFEQVLVISTFWAITAGAFSGGACIAFLRTFIRVAERANSDAAIG